jgi:hypothetical protein
LKPRLETVLSNEGLIAEHCHGEASTSAQPHSVNSNSAGRMIIKDEQMYKHNILRINYTTYDVRRDQDVINPGTSHKDIMTLARSDSSGDNFLYARVLGVYHVNIIWIGNGKWDYRPRRMELLWVRWFDRVASEKAGWAARRLDMLQFLPMEDEDAFGFVDPADVLRSGHLLPRFASGRLHPDGVSMSQCAADGQDWKYYYANR